jgi:hypothetical protein
MGNVRRLRNTRDFIRHPPAAFFVDYTDVFESAAWIFIDKPADYITFRATMLAPLVMLSMHVDALEMSKTKQAGA